MKRITLCLALLFLAGLPARAQAPQPSKIDKLAAELCEENRERYPQLTADQCHRGALGCQQSGQKRFNLGGWLDLKCPAGARTPKPPKAQRQFPPDPKWTAEEKAKLLKLHPEWTAESDGHFGRVGFGVFLVFLYFLPGIVAWRRHHHQEGAIQLLNLLLGWTVIGWIIALIWAATATPGRLATDKKL